MADNDHIVVCGFRLDQFAELGQRINTYYGHYTLRSLPDQDKDRLNRALSDYNPKVIVIQDGRVDGLELAKRLRREHQYKGAIILVPDYDHGFDMSAERRQAIEKEKGVVDMYTTPSRLDAEQIAHAIETRRKNALEESKLPGGRIAVILSEESLTMKTMKTMQKILSHCVAAHRINFYGEFQHDSDLSSLADYDLVIREATEKQGTTFAKALNDQGYEGNILLIFALGHFIAGNTQQIRNAQEIKNVYTAKDGDVLTTSPHPELAKRIDTLVSLSQKNKQKLLANFLSEWRVEADKEMRRLVANETLWLEELQIPEKIWLKLPEAATARAEQILHECRSKSRGKNQDALYQYFAQDMDARLHELVGKLLDKKKRLVDSKPREMTDEERQQAIGEKEKRKAYKRKAETANEDALAKKHAQELAALIEKRLAARVDPNARPYKDQQSPALIRQEILLGTNWIKRLVAAEAQRRTRSTEISPAEISASDADKDHNELPITLAHMRAEMAVRDIPDATMDDYRCLFREKLSVLAQEMVQAQHRQPGAKILQWGHR